MLSVFRLNRLKAQYGVQALKKEKRSKTMSVHLIVYILSRRASVLSRGVARWKVWGNPIYSLKSIHAAHSLPIYSIKESQKESVKKSQKNSVFCTIPDGPEYSGWNPDGRKIPDEFRVNSEVTQNPLGMGFEIGLENSGRFEIFPQNSGSIPSVRIGSEKFRIYFGRQNPGKNS